MWSLPSRCPHKHPLVSVWKAFYQGVSPTLSTRREAPRLSPHSLQEGGMKCTHPITTALGSGQGADCPKLAFSKAFSHLFCHLLSGRAGAVLQ